MLLQLVAVSAYASELPYRHASFENGYQSLASQIEFPNTGSNIVVAIYCSVWVRDTGEKSEVHCLRSDTIDEAFALAVENAVDRATALPATVDGTRHTVEIYFQVLFRKDNGVEEIRVFPNWGDDAHRYGLDYQSAQRLVTKRMLRKCSHPLSGRYSGMGDGLTTVVVDSTGLAVGDVTFEPDTTIPRHRVCIHEIKRVVRRAEFIPAEVNGKAVESVFVELWGDPTNVRLD